MNYLNIGLGRPVSIFDICQAHAQLESDYNSGGWLRERPSNLRRNESTSCQLSRVGYSDPHRWVDVLGTDGDECGGDDDDVREVYLRNVLRFGLPIDAEMMTFIKDYFTAEFISTFPQCAGTDYLQGH